MKIGEVAQITDVSRDTIRLYEKMGLLKLVDRPNEHNNYKEYNADHIKRIQYILNFKKIGFSLKECGEILDSIDQHGMKCEVQSQFMRKKLVEVDEKIEELQATRALLVKYTDR